MNRRCLHCLKFFDEYKSDFIPWCSEYCKIAFNDIKAVTKRYKEIKKKVSEENVFQSLQTVINSIVRRIDMGHPCISSGTKFGHYKVAAGHYFSVGANPTLRYNLLNIYNQSWSDNDHKGGKGSNYSLRLKEVFGEEVRDEIEGLVAKYKAIHLTSEDAKEAKREANVILRGLNEHPNIFTTKQRIELRREFNNRIGIYR
jgi:endogenous inhibitor of DNA gyrase (YacG/DUF329 family)